jgi:hypothetical protein
VRALARLQVGTSLDPARDAALAASWSPGLVPLAKALCGFPVHGPAVLAEQMRQFVVDDRMAETILRHHPDTPRAIELLAPHESALGEGATIAIAEKHIALGQPAIALAHAERVRPLSLRAAEALALIFDATATIAGIDAVSQRFARVPGRILGIRAFHAFLVRKLGRLDATAALAGCNLDPMPADLLTTLLAGSAAAGARGSAAAAAIRVMAERALAVVQEEAEREALTKLLQLAIRACALSAGDGRSS